MLSVRMAYLFWLPSLFGIAGLQRLYIGKVGTGLLYLLTGGLLGIGTLYDAITLPHQVREARFQMRLREALDYDEDLHVSSGYRTRREGEPRRARSAAAIEQVILRTARNNGGVTTPAEVALEGNITTDKAKEYLEKLVSKGFAEVRVKSSGVVVYVFPEFTDEHRQSGFENF